jgi:uncharacterized protein YjbJ (UPF0337 family)
VAELPKRDRCFRQPAKGPTPGVGAAAGSGPSRKGNTNRRELMNKDRVEGSAKQASGTVKESTGKVLGDAKLAADGKSEKVEGKVQNTVGGLKDALKK